MADNHATSAYAPSTTPLPPVTADGLLADRQRFWGAFTNFTVGGIIATIIVVLMVLYFIL
jgi:hypothetical protein